MGTSVKQMNTLIHAEVLLLYVRKLDMHLHVHSRIETKSVREVSAGAVIGAQCGSPCIFLPDVE